MEFIYGGYNETINVADNVLTLPVPSNFHLGQGEPELEEFGCILADGGDQFGVSTVHFDPFEELIWMGNQGGHVTSYYGAEMQKYTSFQVHQTEPVRQIEFLEDGILCLTDTSLRLQLRRGIPKKTHRSKSMLNTQCMIRMSPEKLLISGHQDQIVEFDLSTFAETSTIPVGEDGCAVLRSHSKYLCCGSAFGKVSLRDPRSFSEEHVITTHSGSLSDFDVQGNYLISCGYSGGRLGKLIADRFLLVYDLRMHRLISPIHTVIDPLLLHFLPLHCSRLALLSPLGQLQLVDTVELSKPRVCMYQINTAGSQALSFDISTTTQAMTFGDQAGNINLVSSVGILQPKFNAYSRSTEFPDIIPSLPFVPITDRSFPMASVALPKPTSSSERLSSAIFSPSMFKYQHLKTKPIASSILENMRMNGPIGYALNPDKIVRNMIPYDLSASSSSQDLVMTPINKAKTNHETGAKIIPRRYRKAEIKFSKVGTQEIDYDQYNQTDFSGLEAILPNAYCNPMLQILYFIGPLRKMLLQHSCSREHCLSCELGFLFHMLDISSPPQPPCQASNFLRVFRTVPEASALGLILSDRNSDNGNNLISLIQNWNRFILHQMHSETMEHKRKHTNSETLSSNSAEPAESTTENSDEKSGGVRSRLRINNGIDAKSTNDKDKASSEAATERVEEDESEISQLFGTKQECIHRCLKCNEERRKPTIQMVCNLIFSSALNHSVATSNIEDINSERKTVTFRQVLKSSLCFDKTTPAWCDQCKKFAPTNQRSKVKDLPNILTINTGLDNDRDLEYLRQITGNASGSSAGLPEISPKGLLRNITNGVAKQCRYGNNCSRLDCHFSHPDRKSPSLPPIEVPVAPSSQSKSGEEKLSSWFPISFNMEIKADGDICISDEKYADNYGPKGNEVSTKLKFMNIEEKSEQKDAEKPEEKEAVTTNGTSEKPSSKNYSLTAVVCHVDESSHRNLIALINVEKAYHELKQKNTSTAALSQETRWYLFNDFTVSPVSIQEAVWFTFDWKIPTILYYTCDGLVGNETVETLKDYVSPLTFSLFKEPSFINNVSEQNGGESRKNGIKFQPFTSLVMPEKGYLVAMDAEFVTLNQEENEIRADGKMSTIKPKLQNAARITCVHGQGPFEGIPFIDDYISTHEQVVDYLTKFSGIKPGDLDAHFSKKRLTTLKNSYQKLRYLVDCGVIFVGHGLRNDFRVINMIVPPEQIIDTVYLFHIPHYRMISLRFLAWHFLGIKIQSETHDSIEDARTALLLYKHYLNLKARNSLSLAITNLYEVGMQLMWKIPDN